MQLFVSKKVVQYTQLPPPRTGAKAVAKKPQRQSSFRSGATFPYREFPYRKIPYAPVQL